MANYLVTVAKWPNFSEPELHLFDNVYDATAFAKDAVHTPYTPVGLYKLEQVKDW